MSRVSYIVTKHERGVPQRYMRKHPNLRVPGWELLNVAALAGDIGTGTATLISALTGRRRSQLWVLEKVSQSLGMSLGALSEKIAVSRILAREREEDPTEL